MIIKATEAILESAPAMLYKLGFSAVWSNLGTNRKGKRQITWLWDVSVKANTDAFCISPPTLPLPLTGAPFTTCVQRKLSVFHSSWQTGSSEDKKAFLAWNALWNVFENKVVNDNRHQKPVLSNTFFIVSRPKRACLVLKFQTVG